MHVRITNSEASRRCSKKIRLSSSITSELFHYREPIIFYNDGIYGWNYDFVIYGDIGIYFGNRGFPSSCIQNWRLEAKMEEKIKTLMRHHPTTKQIPAFQKKVDKLKDKIISEFLKAEEKKKMAAQKAKEKEKAKKAAAKRKTCKKR